jgi:polyphosphate kinase
MANESLYSRFPAPIETPPPELLINRELSLLEFNRRVWREGMDPETPLLERLRFLSIVLSNLDQFFLVRVARLKTQSLANESSHCPTGISNADLLDAISGKAHDLVNDVYESFAGLVSDLRQAGIALVSLDELDEEAHAVLDEKFESEIFPALTPLAVKQKRPFPLLFNLSLNLAVRLQLRDGGRRLAVVQVPATLPRLIEIHAGKGSQKTFVLLEEVVARNVSRLFLGYKVLETRMFRITRDADYELDDEGAENFIHAVEEQLRRRRINEPVRLELQSPASPSLTRLLQKSLRLTDADIYPVRGPLDLRGLLTLCDLPGFDTLRYPLMPPVGMIAPIDRQDLFALAAREDLLFHHPYESFEPVVELVRQASVDSKVLAIKQTLYRTSGDSPIVRALEAAALNGKQVTVLVELTARFDEERNISWARKLETAGAHVIYGLEGFKTHAKILLIVRREPQGIRRYVHLSTGNYNDRTARLYTDMGLLTSREDIGSDASGFFNAITGFSDPPSYQKLAMAPLGLRERIISLIERESVRAREGQQSLIRAKMNSLIDLPLVMALCEAARAGVNIQLCVRGVCMLRPGLPDFSGNLKIFSIIDRFLEHSRIFHFYNGGSDEVYLSSADWMPRNLDRRIELMFPVDCRAARRKVLQALDIIFSDNTKAWDLQTDGSYAKRSPATDEPPIRSQYKLYEAALRQLEQQLQEAHFQLRPIEAR